jgi:hypothetical protein
MSPPEVWGPAVWTLFHTLAEKVNEQAYPFVKAQLFAQIRRICGFLPCPECSSDATIFLAKVNINDLKTKFDFRNTFYLFHNMVNAKKRKPLFNYSHIVSYNNYGIVPVINNFISKYNTKGNMKLLAESFQRKLVVSEFTSWFKRNILAFTPPQNVPSPISEAIIDNSVTEESTTTTEDAAVGLCCGRGVVTTEPVANQEVVVESHVANQEVITQETVTEEPSVTEEVITQETVTEEVVVEVSPVANQEVVTQETVTEEVVIEVSPVANQEVVVEESLDATEEFGISSEEVAVEEVVTEESSVTEEVFTEESSVTEEVVSEETSVSEEIIQPKSKKSKKTKKQ